MKVMAEIVGAMEMDTHMLQIENRSLYRPWEQILST